MIPSASIPDDEAAPLYWFSRSSRFWLRLVKQMSQIARAPSTLFSSALQVHDYENLSDFLLSRCSTTESWEVLHSRRLHAPRAPWWDWSQGCGCCPRRVRRCLLPLWWVCTLLVSTLCLLYYWNPCTTLYMMMLCFEVTGCNISTQNLCLGFGCSFFFLRMVNFHFSRYYHVIVIEL
jgi:hypothetical protein